MALPTPTQVARVVAHFESWERADFWAQQQREWDTSHIWGRDMEWDEKVWTILVLYFPELGGGASEPPPPRQRWSNRIPRVPLEQAVKRLATKKGVTRNAIANMAGLSRRQADWIFEWFALKGLSYSERDGVRYPPGTKMADDGKSVRLPPLPSRSAARPRPRPVDVDLDELDNGPPQIW
jgi:hypothetical protein